VQISSLRDQPNHQVGRAFTLRETTARRQAEEQARRRAAILEAVAFVSEQLSKTLDWEGNIAQVLPRLGEVAGASRVYVFQMHPARDGTLLTSQRYEWVAPGITPQIDSPDLQNLPMEAAGFGRWVDILGQDRIVQGAVSELPDPERALLAGQDIFSLVVVPIFVASEWWGFIGFDECKEARRWSEGEVAALRVAANVLGAAIARTQAAQSLHRRAAEFGALYDIARDLMTTVDLPTLLQKILEHTLRLLAASDGIIYLYDESQHELKVAAVKIPFSPIGARVSADQGVSGEVIRTRQPIRIDNYRAWKSQRPEYGGIDLRAVAQAPLLYAGKLIGVLGVGEIGNDRQFSDADMHLLELLASLGAGAVHNVDLLDESQRRAEQISALYATSLELVSPRDLQSVLRAVVERACKLLNVPAGGLYLCDPQKQQARCVISYNTPRDYTGIILR